MQKAATTSTIEPTSVLLGRRFPPALVVRGCWSADHRLPAVACPRVLGAFAHQDHTERWTHPRILSVPGFWAHNARTPESPDRKTLEAARRAGQLTDSAAQDSAHSPRAGMRSRLYRPCRQSYGSLNKNVLLCFALLCGSISGSELPRSVVFRAILP